MYKRFKLKSYSLTIGTVFKKNKFVNILIIDELCLKYYNNYWCIYTKKDKMQKVF